MLFGNDLTFIVTFLTIFARNNNNVKVKYTRTMTLRVSHGRYHIHIDLLFLLSNINIL